LAPGKQISPVTLFAGNVAVGPGVFVGAGVALGGGSVRLGVGAGVLASGVADGLSASVSILVGVRS
jgi:hypothetical protein